MNTTLKAIVNALQPQIKPLQILPDPKDPNFLDIYDNTQLHAWIYHHTNSQTIELYHTSHEYNLADPNLIKQLATIINK
ncbi:MAG: hypothetical protein JRD89_02195 [Deltaproteobacteria bacterium]|nr:hypothetical protein [Deltaproteobacteria bacterium]